MSALATALRRATADAPRVALVTFLVGVAVLARTQLYYGGLLRGWDAQFYYAAARSLVFDRDLDITNDLRATSYPAPFDRDGDGTFEAVRMTPSGQILSPYPIGLSLIEAPLLGLGTGLRAGFARVGVVWPQAAGFSPLEIWTVALGLLAVFAVGLQLLDAILRPHIRSPWRELALFGTWWGTSLLYYSSVFPFMAHAVGFTIVVWVVWLGWRIGAGSCGLDRLWLLGFALGALYLVRQQQLVIVLPLLLVLAPLRARPLRTWIGWSAAAVVTALAVMATQATAHAHLAGTWLMDVVQFGEFDWLRPRPWTVLLSPSRGLLWMSPVVLVAAAGYVVTPLRDVPRPFVVFALLGLIQMYVIACWFAPEQGDAFGSRMWMESAGAVACGVALLYGRAGPAGKLAISAVLVACTAWTTRLLVLYVSGRLPLGVSYGECVRDALGS